VLLAALLCTALGLALARAPAKALLPACLVLAAAAFAAAGLVGTDVGKWAVIGCAASILATALLVHLPRGPSLPVVFVLAGNTGIWCGALDAASSSASPLLALPFALVALPGRWIVARDRAIVLKVLSGWLVAVAILAAALPLVTTPGYQKDHKE
jgi:hypothetical protein